MAPHLRFEHGPRGDRSAYAIRSGHAANVVLGYDLRRKDLDYALLRKLTAEWRQIVACYQGDYYPLTPTTATSIAGWRGSSIGRNRAMAWSRPSAARRRKPPRARFDWLGLDPSARYRVTDLDSLKASTLSGSELVEHGLTVQVDAKPGAAVVRYERLK